MLKKTKKIIWLFLKILSYFFKIFFILLTLFLTFVAIFKKEWVESFIEWMRLKVEILWAWNYLIAWLSSWIEAIPALWTLLPWQNILLLVWWFFWSISLNNIMFLILVASIWWIIWNFIWFYLWKLYWDSFFEKYWIWFWIWKTEVRYLEKWIKKWWAFWIIIWKFHPLTRSFLPFIAWSMKMKSRVFMFYNTIWSIFYSTVIVLIWVLFIENYKIILEYIGRVLLFLIVSFWLYVYFYKKEDLDNYIKEKKLEMDGITKKVEAKMK